uniref:Dolichyl-diphosphooligosaccharide--protein glycosyltransferase subunit 1 n=1 Tax=Lynceus sp. MCZ IZ 141354 TaxID=1930659 RepID=A0A9N6WSY1_9CRUS|nr:EOG090X04O4 [Lynceus sp. MCZ IZ 141354]
MDDRIKRSLSSWSDHQTQITQREKQLILFQGSAYLYTPYPVTTQTTKITLTSPNVESFTKVKPSSQSDTTITYGPYENIAPNTVEAITVHYENNAPFLTVTSLDRHVEVSHWGNIAVEETIDVYHTGAKLKGSFSRFEYQREQSGVSSVRSFKTVLPAAASDVYYRDEIGNISTSHLREGRDAVELELRPRFPLFGGWKTHYVIGYNVPSYEYLYNSGEQYVLNVRLIDHIYDDMVIEKAHVKIILPEGAHDIEVDTPYTVKRLPDTLHFTYLDVKGRPVIHIEAENLVESHIQDITIRYKFWRLQMLQEPLLLVIALLLLFLTVIIYVRLDFSITKDEASEHKLKAASLVESVKTRQEKRNQLYSDYEEQMSKFKSSKDNNSFQSGTKGILNELKSETQTISEVVGQIKDAAVTDRIGQLQKLDKDLREVLGQQGQLIEKLVSGKTGKPQYSESDAPLAKKKEELKERINTILASL